MTVILLIFLCLEGLLFFTFTAVMFGTQIHSICNDETVRALPARASCVLSAPVACWGQTAGACVFGRVAPGAATASPACSPWCLFPGSL